MQLAGEMTKSHSYDCATSSSTATAANQRDSICSAVSDSELTQRSCSILTAVDWATSGNNRLLVSKDSNWTLASASTATSSSSSSSILSTPTAPSGDLLNPVERAEKLLAVLKHRLFSAQLNCSYTTETCSSLPQPVTKPPTPPPPPPPAPSSSQKQDVTSPSVRALVQVLEKRAKPPLNPRPCLTTTTTTKDEGYSTLSSDVNIVTDSSSSSSSSFIATTGSGCSSPATLRRSGSTGSNSRRSTSSTSVTTRSLPMLNKRPPPALPIREEEEMLPSSGRHKGSFHFFFIILLSTVKKTYAT